MLQVVGFWFFVFGAILAAWRILDGSSPFNIPVLLGAAVIATLVIVGLVRKYGLPRITLTKQQRRG